MNERGSSHTITPKGAATPAREPSNIWIRTIIGSRSQRRITLTREMLATLGVDTGDRLTFRQDGQGRLIVERLDGKKLADPELQAKVEETLHRQRAASMRYLAQHNLWEKDYFRHLEQQRQARFTPAPPASEEAEKPTAPPLPGKHKRAG